MVLAAGRGRRMRPSSDTSPKSLLAVGGTATLDRVLDHLARAGVRRAVVNLHHQGPRFRAHLGNREVPAVAFSDEAEALLDTGGGVRLALGRLGAAPFFVVNAISLWLDGPRPALGRLAAEFDPEGMDALLLVHATARAVGYDGAGDFHLLSDGRLARRGAGQTARHVFTGVQILAPELFVDAPEGAFSLNRLYDRAEAAGRLFGLAHDGEWMNLKTPEGLAVARETFSAHPEAGDGRNP